MSLFIVICGTYQSLFLFSRIDKYHTLTITQYLTISLQHLIVCTNKPRAIINQNEERFKDIPGDHGGHPVTSVGASESKMSPGESSKKESRRTSKHAPGVVELRPSGSP